MLQVLNSSTFMCLCMYIHDKTVKKLKTVLLLLFHTYLERFFLLHFEKRLWVSWKAFIYKFHMLLSCNVDTICGFADLWSYFYAVLLDILSLYCCKAWISILSYLILSRITYYSSIWHAVTVWVRVCSYPEGAPLTELKHPKHTVLKLHRAVELGQVVVIYTQQLKHEDMVVARRRKWQGSGEVGKKELTKRLGHTLGLLWHHEYLKSGTWMY